MSSELTCPYCQSSNPARYRFCAACHARLPEMILGAGEGGAESSPEVEDRIALPRPGAMIAGLVRLVGEAVRGEIEGTAFAARLAEMSGKVEEAFSSIVHEVVEVPVEAEGFGEFVVQLLQNVHFMFQAALGELSAFAEDGDPVHLRFGQVLAQRAEAEYLDVIRMLRREAAGHPFAEVPDAAGTLAGELAEGRISSAQYLDLLEDLGQALTEELVRAGELIRSGLALARRFEGTDTAPMEEARSKLNRASQLLSQAVLRLAAPEEVERGLQEALDQAGS